VSPLRSQVLVSGAHGPLVNQFLKLVPAYTISRICTPLMVSRVLR